MKNKLKTANLFFLTIFIFLSTGCADISNRKINTSEKTNTGSTAGNTDEHNYSNAAGNIIPAETEFSDGEIYSTYTFSETEEKFLSSLTFIGDSICMGLSSYGMLEKSQVIAEDSVAARNILDFKFGAGENDSNSADLLSALVNLNPNYIVISLGINDLNMTDEPEFCSNYIKLISLIKNYCTEANLIILSITPVNQKSIFTDNSVIESYNKALQKSIDEFKDNSVRYVDIGAELKNPNGELKSKYAAGDGIHLTEKAYHAILWQICKSTELDNS